MSVEPGVLVEMPSVCVMRRSVPFAVVVAVALLFAGFGSVVLDDTVAVFVSVVPAALGLAFTMIVNVPVSPLDAVVFVKVTVPVPPTAGVMIVHPTGAFADTNVVPAGSGSVSETFRASLPPLFAKSSV